MRAKEVNLVIEPMSLNRSGVPASPAAILIFIAALLLCLALGASPAAAQETEADVYVAQAILAYDDKRYPETLSLLAEALKLEPENTQALYYTGLVHLAQKNPTLAVEYLEKARAKSPTTPIIQYQLGVAYFDTEQYDKAEPLLV